MGEGLSSSGSGDVDGPVITTTIPNSLTPTDPRVVLCSRTDEWGVEWEWLQLRLHSDWHLRLIVKAGRGIVRAIISENQAAQILSFGPWSISALWPYHAYVFDDEVIEASITGLGPLSPSVYSHMRDRRWVQTSDLEYTPAQTRELAFYPPPWRVEISGQPVGAKVEIGTASPRFSALDYSLSIAETIRISGIPFQGHDQAVTVLEEIRNGLAFEFDLRYGAGFDLRRRSVGRFSAPSGLIGEDLPAPDWPQNDYSADALALYWYARSAMGLPLLEYLAYYQVLEYYFPHHVWRESITALREELKDPRFRADSDDDLSRILQIASTGAGLRGTEEDQVQAAVRGTVSRENLIDFINSHEAIVKGLTGKKILDGVPQLNLQDKGSDLRDQLARRIYAIRCRIVHSKVDGGARRSAPLLPFSQEAGRLGADIQVLRFLAQKAIIVGSTPRRRGQ